MSDLRHMADLVAFELHHIHVVRFYLLPDRRHRSTFRRVRTPEHRIRRHVVTLLVHREGLKLISSIGHRREQTLHPVGVRLQRLDVRPRAGLG